MSPPATPPRIERPVRNPAAAEGRPTKAQKEKVSPGATTTPSSRAAPRRMFASLPSRKAPPLISWTISASACGKSASGAPLRRASRRPESRRARRACAMRARRLPGTILRTIPLNIAAE